MATVNAGHLNRGQQPIVRRVIAIERREFRPSDLWMDSSTQAAVGAGNHIFAADNLCETHDPIRDEARMLDHVRRMTDHSGNENFVLRQFYFLPHAPFVLMAYIARLDRVGLRANGEHEVDNVGRTLPAAFAASASRHRTALTCGDQTGGGRVPSYRFRSSSAPRRRSPKTRA